ncbi:proline dehydrogenase family protein [Flavobacteriaceae bacterium]|nr:proline dehydrogenase family protein [Flavobacteriales bacterium]MBL6877559.1 proline dehydrogenase family protein [Flavobacteriaceae bacterium]MDA9849363.1 proline dehydrogenase family protein [Flavobacteriaceae bacterium]
MQDNLFDNTEIAFKDKSIFDLYRGYIIFKIISFPRVVSISKFILSFKLIYPLTKLILKSTMLKQFCGGQNEDDCKKIINDLNARNVYSILDYSVEGLENEVSFDETVSRTINLIKLNTNNNFPFIVFKPTGIGRFDLYEKISSNTNLSDKENIEWSKVKARYDVICNAALANNVSVLIDAEESWIQSSIDEIYENLILKYNSKKAIVYNTVQSYRIDRLEYIEKLYHSFSTLDVQIGIKLVRGAYMDKERERSKAFNYLDPIHKTKKDTDKSFNSCMTFMFKNVQLFSVFIGSHNEESNYLALELINKYNIIKDKVWFSQLYGMSDHITYNLSNQGFNVTKYLPFGPFKGVIPYLFRRAEENTAVEGQTSRELFLYAKEIKRRNHSKL